MKPTEKEIKTALNIFDKLLDMGMDHLTSSSAYLWCRHHDEELGAMGIHYGCGATKLVLICEELENWVIKAGENFFSDEGDIGVSNDFRNYCADEADLYKKACAQGLGRFFAATYKIRDDEAFTICLQEKVDANGDYFQDLICDYMDDNEIDCENDEDRLDAVFGPTEHWEDVRELMDFAESYGINDLHYENYGIKKDGTFVIIDFSGYDSEYSY